MDNILYVSFLFYWVFCYVTLLVWNNGVVIIIVD